MRGGGAAKVRGWSGKKRLRTGRRETSKKGKSEEEKASAA